MTPIAPTEFTPWLPLLGGVLIGLSAVLLMAILGRIAGIAGITSGALGALVPVRGAPADRAWRLTFVMGLISAPILVSRLSGQAPEQTVSGNLPVMALAGLLVGLGTALGSGCTSGHGVCGIARLSPRSFVAVAIFMAVAIVTVWLTRHGVGGAV